MTASANEVGGFAVEPVAQCGACGSAGDVLYRDIDDRLFGVPGRWSVRRCRNAACGALWLDPRPTEADIGRAYQTYYTHGAGNPDSLIKRLIVRLSKERARQRFGLPAQGDGTAIGRLLLLAAHGYPGLVEHVDLMIRYSAPPPPGQVARVLDIGCGDGEALAILRELGWQVVGLETDPAAAEAARRRGLEVQQGLLADAPFAPESFDLITSSHVIEHVHDPLAHLGQVRRLLRPGGRTVIVTPNVNCGSHRRHGRHWRGLEVPRHIMVHTPASLASLVRRAGFSAVDTGTSARAVSLSEVAAVQVRAGQTPALTPAPAGLRLRAMLAQARESLAHQPGALDGNEIVLVATR